MLRVTCRPLLRVLPQRSPSPSRRCERRKPQPEWVTLFGHDSQSEPAQGWEKGTNPFFAKNLPPPGRGQRLTVGPQIRPSKEVPKRADPITTDLWKKISKFLVTWSNVIPPPFSAKPESSPFLFHSSNHVDNYPACPMLRQEEDGYGCRPVQG